jgi:hypothetical protein
MLVEILVRRHEAIEGVAEEAVAEADFAAVLRLQAAAGRIDVLLICWARMQNAKQSQPASSTKPLH